MTSALIPLRNFFLYLAGLLGLAHGLSDAAAGYLLGGLVTDQLPAPTEIASSLLPVALSPVALLFFLYSVLGFGGQPIAGQIVDRYRCPRLAVVVGLGCQILALHGVAGQPEIAIALAGVGSALFHVGGGALILDITPCQTTASGLFTAPGVVGLAVGGVLGTTKVPATVPLLCFLGIVVVAIALLNVASLPHPEPTPAVTPSPDPDVRDWMLLALTSAIALISTVWTTFQWVFQDRFDLLIAVAVMSAIVKVIGGWLADRWGWYRWYVFSLLLAAVFLAAGRSPIVLLIGLAFLQSTIPLTLVHTARFFPRQPATATGFALGLAILLGGFPIMVGIIPDQRWAISLVLMAILLPRQSANY